MYRENPLPHDAVGKNIIRILILSRSHVTVPWFASKSSDMKRRAVRKMLDYGCAWLVQDKLHADDRAFGEGRHKGVEIQRSKVRGK